VLGGEHTPLFQESHILFVAPSNSLPIRLVVDPGVGTDRRSHNSKVKAPAKTVVRKAAFFLKKALCPSVQRGSSPGRWIVLVQAAREPRLRLSAGLTKLLAVLNIPTPTFWALSADLRVQLILGS
jgi:hypothetical protein